MLRGIDVSYWQGEIDWKKVKEEVDFVIIRSSYGVGFTDKQFPRNRDETRKLEIPRGFYHYAYPNHNEPEAEARYFASVVGEPEKGEILILDFEENYPDPVGWSKRFLDELSSLYNGYLPMIYLNKFTVQNFDWREVKSTGYGLWLAYWTYDPNSEFSVPYWNTVAMRQYSNQGAINGIKGRVDLNVFYGDMTQYEKYGYLPEPSCKAMLTMCEDQLLIMTEKIKVLKEKNQKLKNKEYTVSESLEHLFKALFKNPN